MARRLRVRTLTVRVVLKPRARVPRVICDGDGLVVSVRSPPVEGRANAEAAALVAQAFAVPKSRVALVRGARGRVKRFEITNPARIPNGLTADK